MLWQILIDWVIRKVFDDKPADREQRQPTARALLGLGVVGAIVVSFTVWLVLHR